MKQITSVHNDAYKALKGLLTKKQRTQQGIFLVEGVRLVRHVLERGWPLREIVFDIREAGRPELRQLAEDAVSRGIRLTELEGALFEALSDTVQSQGCLGVAEMPETQPRTIEGSFFIALDQIRDPGNLGTILRTADAAGVDGVLLSKGCVEPFNEKVVRATMGSLFDVPLVQTGHLTEPLSEFRNRGFEIVVAVLEDSVNYVDYDWTRPTVLVIGNEADGISPEVQNEATQRVSIPIRGGAESLNAAVAAAVLVYEAMRQRKK